jgi:hypothetical protein
MICYRDRSYCDSDCRNTTCDRFVSQQLINDANAFGLPLALTDYSKNCPGYTLGKPDDHRKRASLPNGPVEGTGP